MPILIKHLLYSQSIYWQFSNNTNGTKPSQRLCVCERTVIVLSVSVLSFRNMLRRAHLVLSRSFRWCYTEWVWPKLHLLKPRWARYMGECACVCKHIILNIVCLKYFICRTVTPLLFFYLFKLWETHSSPILPHPILKVCQKTKVIQSRWIIFPI